MNFFSKPTKQTYSLVDEEVEGACDGMLAAISRLQPHEACARMGSTPEGLIDAEAAARIKKFGPNLVARERKPTIPEEIWNRARNPLNGLLLTLAAVSYFLGDARAAIVIATMVVLAITTAFIGAPVQRGRSPAACHGSHHRECQAQARTVG
ncbi:cation-transporting P-type ATPase [Bradyrhizobium uaiense]|uniref:cation-transporting P-type ATPase n=1 Tax=Bradyrhizobium uaiense TaxID=2594946 RepID=UPI001EECCE24|nr:cation-transporting P-type ATPase [Bradyrhizobium uaiense]